MYNNNFSSGHPQNPSVILISYCLLCHSSFYRSVVVAPKRMGGAPSPGMSTVSAAASVPSATAASSAGTPVNSVSVVSAGETVESTESAPGECLHERACQ